MIKRFAIKDLGLPLFMIFLVGVFLRLYRISYQSLWADEITTYTQSGHTVFNIFFHPLTLIDPPFHPILIKFLHLFGNGELLIRLPSAIAGILSIPIMYFLVRELSSLSQRDTTVEKTVYDAGKILILTTVLLFSISPFHVYLSQEARAFSILIFFTLLSTLLFLKFIRSEKLGYLFWYIITSTVSFYFHCLIAFIFISNNLFLMIFFKKYKHLWKTWFLSQVIHFILLTPYFYITINGFYAYFSQSLGWELEKPRSLFENIWTIGTILLWFSHGGSLNFGWSPHHIQESDYLFRFLIKIPFLLIFLPLIIMGLFNLRKRSQNSLFILLWFFTPFIMVFLLSFKINWLMDRHLVTALPPFILILSLGLESIKNKGIKYLSLGLVSLLCIVSLGNYYFNGDYRKEPWREVAAFVDKHFQEGDIVFIHAPHIKPCFEYYSKGKYKIEGLSQDISKSQKALIDNDYMKNKKRIWLILSHNSRTKDFYPKFFGRYFETIEHKKYPKIELYLYSKFHDF